MLDTVARNWWAFILRGVFAILFGILAFVVPGITLQALVFVFGFYALLDGIFAVVFGSSFIALGWRLKGVNDRVGGGGRLTPAA